MSEPELFDGLPGHAAPEKPVRITKKGLYAALPGTGPAGETCRTCNHLSGKYQSRRYYKCELTRALWTGGPGTDVKVRSPACSKWEILPEDAVEKAQRRYDRTHSHAAWEALKAARLKALQA